MNAPNPQHSEHPEYPELPSEGTGGQALAGQLLREGVRDLFLMPGVQLDWAVDALYEVRDQIRTFVPRHEQAVSYMADGYARSSGRPGVGMVVPGPGMLNALAGLATGYACNSKMAFISGQVPSQAMGRGLGVLHEIPDQSGILQRLTKWHGLASSVEHVPATLQEAFKQLDIGRPRPVAVEVPQDVLQSRGPVALLPPAGHEAKSAGDPKLLATASALLESARCPVIIAGGGVLAANAQAALACLAERLQAPVLITENGTGALSTRHPLALNWLASRALLPHADVVLCVGSRCVDPQGQPLRLAPGAQLILVNADARDLGAPRQPRCALEADADAALRALTDLAPDQRRCSDRVTETSQKVARLRHWCHEQMAAIAPQRRWLSALRSAMADDAFLVADLTQIGYPAHLGFDIHTPGTFLGAGYQGTLGFAYPTALGVAAAHPGREVVAVVGDGGFGWTLQELATAKRYQLPVVVVVFNNDTFGNVALMQERQFGRSFASELTNPDFVQLAQAFGVHAQRAGSPQELEPVLREALQARRPALIEVHLGPLPSPWALIRGSPSAHPNPLGEPT